MAGADYMSTCAPGSGYSSTCWRRHWARSDRRDWRVQLLPPRLPTLAPPLFRNPRRVRRRRVGRFPRPPARQPVARTVDAHLRISLAGRSLRRALQLADRRHVLGRQATGLRAIRCWQAPSRRPVREVGATRATADHSPRSCRPLAGADVGPRTQLSAVSWLMPYCVATRFTRRCSRAPLLDHPHTRPQNSPDAWSGPSRRGSILQRRLSPGCSLASCSVVS